MLRKKRERFIDLYERVLMVTEVISNFEGSGPATRNSVHHDTNDQSVEADGGGEDDNDQH